MPIIFKGSGNKKPKLYYDWFYPRTWTSTHTPKAGYDGFSSVRVYGYDYYKTDGNASSSDVRSGKTFYSGGSSRTGNMSDVTMPLPSEEHSFSSDKKQITFTVSYTPPSTGYNGYATTRTHTSYIDMPSAGNQSAVFKTGNVNSMHVFKGGVYYETIVIPAIDGRTLKHLSFTASSETYDRENSTNTYTKNGDNLVMTVHIYNFGESSQEGDNTAKIVTGDISSGNIYYYAEYAEVDISSDNNIEITNASGSYSIGMKSTKYSMAKTYRYVAIYE